MHEIKLLFTDVLVNSSPDFLCVQTALMKTKTYYYCVLGLIMIVLEVPVLCNCNLKLAFKGGGTPGFMLWPLSLV